MRDEEREVARDAANWGRLVCHALEVWKRRSDAKWQRRLDELGGDLTALAREQEQALLDAGYVLPKRTRRPR